MLHINFDELTKSLSKMNEASIHSTNCLHTSMLYKHVKHIIYIYGVHASSGSRQTSCRESCRESVTSAKAVAGEFNGACGIRLTVGTVSSLHSPPLELLILLDQRRFLGVRATTFRVLWN
jgi:hypothetical protein